MRIARFEVQDKEVTLYLAAGRARPLVILNTYAGDGREVVAALQELHSNECNLLCVGKLNWEHDLTPWDCPPLSAKEVPGTGGSDDYLKLLVHKILPEAKAQLQEQHVKLYIAGYSLAGLFALYALYQSEVFAGAASMSGSLWFPGFKAYCMEHQMQSRIDRLYLSLGDKEAQTSHRLLRTVRQNTEELLAYYKAQGLSVAWELNAGNHFKEVAARCAKGIMALLG